MGPDGDQILLQQPLLIGDLLGVGGMLLVLLHLLVGQIQHTLQLVLRRRDESSSRGVNQSKNAAVKLFSRHTPAEDSMLLQSLKY